MKSMQELFQDCFEVCPNTGELTQASRARILAEYGLDVLGGYSFVAERVFRLADGRIFFHDGQRYVLRDQHVTLRFGDVDALKRGTIPIDMDGRPLPAVPRDFQPIDGPPKWRQYLDHVAAGGARVEDEAGLLYPAAQDQPPPQPGQKSVTDKLVEVMKSRYTPVKLIEEVLARREVGRRRYGTELFTHNGRDALVDAIAELMDAAMYLTQAQLEDPDFPMIAMRDNALNLLEWVYRFKYAPSRRPVNG